MKKKLIAGAIGAAAVAAVSLAPVAQAVPLGIGCETIHWGLFGYQRRTVCDGPIRPDGSWERGRVVWVPAHYVPFSCFSGTYSSSCSGGYSVDTSIVAQEKYVVFPSNVLPDEPGWLPPGTDTIR